MKNKYLSFGTIMTALSLFLNVSISAQNICSNSSFEQGGFNPNLNEICGTQALIVTNTSTATNIKYVYDYQGETLESALDSASTQVNHTYPLLYQPKMYTIAQIGQKNGKVSVACKNVIVRPNNTPLHSYFICQSTVEFNIPLSPINDFDRYVIEFGSGVPPIFVSKSQLPFSVQKTFNLPQTYKITGLYTDPSKNCLLNYGFQTIPLNNPNTELPFTPQISKVELLTLKNVKIDYTGPFVADPQFSLFRYEKDQYPAANEIKAGIQTGSYTFDIPDSTKSYCFFVKRNSTCGGQIIESPEICTTPIVSLNFNPQNSKTEISWIAYQKTLKGRTLPPPNLNPQNNISFKQTFIIDKPIIPNQKGEISWATNTYTHGPLDCTTQYTYQVYQDITGSTNFTKFKGKSISNKVNFDPQKLIPPPPTTFWVNTDNYNQIHYKEDLNTWPIEQKNWYLFKLQDTEFKILDSSSTKNTFLTDFTTPQKQETYKIAFRDKCGRLSQLSEKINTIFLSINDLAELRWSLESPFGNSTISGYDLIFISNGTETKIQSFPKEITNGTLDLNTFSSDGKLKLVATPSNNNYPIAASNTIDLKIPLKIFIPTAFTPNNDGINDLLEIKTLKSKIKTFEMKIYNRFGQEILKIDNVEYKWDGKINSTATPSGNYPYTITITTSDNSIKRFGGSIYLLKH
ncbi:T9SS type B sorting domain-containing protein [Lacihabitans lacunae]|uniref:Gliding motility-associated C-terminal domain-containing protein n=1 Tax=Lacihabitans lacunae TaxID=1028214 RepID=A0ABV7Z1E0_9BACT